MGIIGLVASPRKEGNTAWTVNQILEGAKEQGAETRCWYFGELDIKPCQGCSSCARSGVCVIDDDMGELYGALNDADAIVLGTPVYMGQMSGQAKVFTDRLFSQITPRLSSSFKEGSKGKKLILVFTQGNPDSELFWPYFDHTKNMFQMLKFEVKGIRVVAGTRDRQAWESEELHAVMKKVGAELVPSRKG